MRIGKSNGDSSSIEALPFSLCQVDNETNEAEFIIFLTIPSHRVLALGTPDADYSCLIRLPRISNSSF